VTAADEKVIRLSRKKVSLLILGSVAFVALGVWLVSMDEAAIRSSSRFNDPTLVHGVAIVAIVFFGLCGIFAVRKLFDDRPGLVLNSSGIVDNSSGLAAGLIPWSDIAGAEIYQIHRQKLLIIKLRDPEKYVQRGSSLRQMINRANLKMCGSPVAISSHALSVSFPELLSLFVQYQQKYGRA
jgi:hypothetical protein